MSPEAVSAELEVEVKESGIMGRLRFTNHSKQAVSLEKINGCLDGVIENNVFRIVSDGKSVEYSGILAKRQPPGPGDFRKIEPGRTLETVVNLSKAYDFFPGSHTYRVTYKAYHSYPGNSDFWILKSNEAAFTASR